MDQIDIKTYHELTINQIYFCGDCVFTRGYETRMTCYALFKIKYVHVSKHFISLCKNSPNRHHLNQLSIITLIYTMYIEYALYNLAYRKYAFSP